MDYYFSIGNIKCKVNNCINKESIVILDAFCIPPCERVDINFYLHDFDYSFLKKISAEKPLSTLDRVSVYNFENKFYYVVKMSDDKIYYSVLDPDNRNKIDLYIDNTKWNDVAFFNIFCFEFLLLRYNGFILHSSVVSTKYGGIIFSAPSQTGKSTQGRLWEQYENATVINGDKGIYRKFSDGWRVYGAPWAGTSGIYHNDYIDLKAAFIISQGKSNGIKRLSPVQAFSAVLSQAFLPYWDKDLADEGMKIIEEFVKEVPIYSFECTPDEAAVQAVKELLLTFK